jgi:apolipoprotein D and lipocalin family protein
MNNFIIFILLMLMSGVLATSAKGQELNTVDVDLNRYAGKWYEIAKYPNKFQRACKANTTANYSLKANGKIEVVNECLEADGSTKRAVGEAKVPNKAETGKLKVRFAPGWLSWLPWVWGNYWVIELDPDYQYSVIGDPGRDYFWILSREPKMDEATYQGILERAKAKGFDPARVELSPQGVAGS